MSLRRRDWLAGASGAVLAATLPGCAGRARPPRDLAWSSADDALAVQAPRYRAAAEAAARWIRHHARETPSGIVWPIAPSDPETTFTWLYNGSAGTALFLADWAVVADDRRSRDLALAAAEHLAATVPDTIGPGDCGLYEGVCGHAFALDRLGERFAVPRLRDAARGVVDRLLAAAALPETDVRSLWQAQNDVIPGLAGTGLYLLDAHARALHPRALELAVQVGDVLLVRGEEAPGGRRWRWAAGADRVMPNFSHGTAGIAYFLARLAAATAEPRFQDAALAGARHLLAIAHTRGDVCLIHHVDPEGLDRYYLSWCHGPAGTGRLFEQLYRNTGEPEWRAWLARGANGIFASGIPELRTTGYWNNVSRCCGHVGVGEHILDLHELTRDEAHLRFALRLADDLLVRATNDAQGMSWVQAENRVDPWDLAAQTNLMQGAAGVGSYFLRLHGRAQGKDHALRLPDTPFGGLSA